MNANKQDAGGLLPCPFCGGEPIQYDYADGYGIHCGNVECTIDMFATSRDSDADARAIWNRRNGELCRAAPAGGEPAAYRITDGEGSYEYRDELPDQRSIEWSARYGRKWEPLYTRPQVSAPAGSGEVLTDHGVKALDRCCGELRKFIELAEDYDLDEMSVQALQTAIESMEMRKAAAMQAKEAK